MLKGELETAAIVLREGTDAKIDAGEVESLARAQFATDSDLAVHLIARDEFHLKLHQSIIQIKPVAWFHHAR